MGEGSEVLVCRYLMYLKAQGSRERVREKESEESRHN